MSKSDIHNINIVLVLEENLEKATKATKGTSYKDMESSRRLGSGKTEPEKGFDL